MASSHPVPTTMRSWTFTRRGPSDKVLSIATQPTPTPMTLAQDELLVRIIHAGIFQSSAIMMFLTPHFNSRPWIPYTDFSGTVIAAGSAITHVSPGDAVFGFPNPSKYYMTSSRYNGLLTEYAIIPGCAAVKRPANVSTAEAAAAAGNGLAALQFCERAGLREGMKVLVTAASSSTGSFTVQIAKHLVGKSGIVVGTCSAANEELVKGLGVDEVIDYRRHTEMHSYLIEMHSSKPFDAIIDLAGASDDLFHHCPKYLKPEGVFLHVGKISVFANEKPSFLKLMGFIVQSVWKSYLPAFLGGVPRKNFFHGADVNEESLRKVARLMEDGHLKSLIDSELEFGDALKAFERARSGRARGKVLVRVHEN